MTNRIVTRALELERKHGGAAQVLRALGEEPSPEPAPSKKLKPQPVRVRAPKPWPRVTHTEPRTQWAAWITALVDWRDRSDDRVEEVIGRLGEPWTSMLHDKRSPTDQEWADLLAGLGLGRRPLTRASIAHWDELVRRHGAIVALVPDGIGAHEKLEGVVVVGLVGDGTAKGTEVEWLDPMSGELRTTSFAEFDQAFAVPGSDEEAREVMLWPPGERLAKEPAAMALRVQPGFAGELGYKPGDSDNPAKLKWKNLTMATGSDGKPHLYALVTGGPKGRVVFDLEVTNTNDHKNLNDQKVSVSLKAVGDAKSKWSEKVIPLEKQPKGHKYYSWKRKGGLVDNTSEIIPIELKRATLEKAYDPDHPLCRLDVEYRFEEYGVLNDEPGYQTNALWFYLMEPTNLMWSQKKYVGEVRFDDPNKHKKYWTGLAERRFGKHDRTSIKVEGTVSYSVSKGTTKTVRSDVKVSTTKSDTNATEVAATIGGKTSQSITAKLPLADLLELGIQKGNELSGSVTYKNLHSVTKSQTNEFVRSVGESQQFTSLFSTTKRISVELEPGPVGVRRILYTYPVYKLYRMPLVIFDSNNSGHATKRRVVKDFPVLVPSHPGFYVDPPDPTPPPQPTKR